MALFLNTIAILPINNEAMDVGSHAVWFIDESNQLTINEAVERLETTGRKADREENPNFGFNNGTVYLALTLSNQINFDRFVLELGYPLLNHATLYTLRKDGKLELALESGNRATFGARYRPYRTINFSILVKPGEEIGLILKAKSSSSLQMPLHLYTERKFGDITTKENFGLGIYYGFILVMILFNSFLLISLKDRNYLWYVGFLASYLLFQMCVNGTAFQYLLPGSPRVAEALLPISFFSGFGFSILFVAGFLDLRWRQRRIASLMWVLFVLSFVFAVVSLVVPYFAIIKIIAFWGGFIPMVILVTSVRSLLMGYIPARYFVVGWGMLIAGMITYSLKTFGILPTNFFTEYTMQIGSAMEVILLSIALADRYKLIMSLAQETLHQRAETQSQLRREMETRVAIVSDLAHRMNNPLNYIVTGANALSIDFNNYHNSTVSLLQNDDIQDNESRKIKDNFTQKKAEINVTIDGLCKGVERSAASVEEIRALSGVDGKNLRAYLLTEVVYDALKRTEEQLEMEVESRVVFEFDQQIPWKIFGNRPAFVICIERIACELLAKSAGNVVIAIDEQYARQQGGRDFLLVDVKTVIEGQPAYDYTALGTLECLLYPCGGSVVSLAPGEEVGYRLKIPSSYLPSIIHEEAA